MIDTKGLRIGSHILVDGDRYEVFGISPKGIALRSDCSPFGFACPSKKANIEPIPLTAELLTEIGFEQELSYYILTLPDEATIYADAVEDEMNNWNIQVFATKLYKRGDMFVRYLHELENFVYMTLHKELIEK